MPLVFSTLISRLHFVYRTLPFYYNPLQLTLSQLKHSNMAYTLTNYNKHHFFDADFKNGKELWNSMAEYPSIWSSSRALNEFIPGTCDKNSNYDFYTFDNSHVIYGMIRALKHAGVVITSLLHSIKTKISTGSTISFPCWKAQKLVESFNASWAPQYTSPLMNSIIAWLRQTCKQIIQLGNKLQEAEQAYNWAIEGGKKLTIKIRANIAIKGYDHIAKLQVLRGETHTGKKIQLIFAPSITPVDHILRFHSTVIQCFICPYTAVHFYWNLIKQRKAWAWAENTALLTGRVTLDHHEAGIQKYKNRGFVYILCRFDCIKYCTIDSKGVHFIMSIANDMSSSSLYANAAYCYSILAIC